jgi:hypothetical protein
MGSNKPLEIDMVAGSELRDSQGEMLSVSGADISELIAGRGRFNDNHGKGFFNSIGIITEAKKIFKAEDCENDRHRYYWDKVKSPYIYARGYIYNDEDHANARAAAAIMRNIHKNDIPLKMKSSVEGGVIARGINDETFLARTKITQVALTFTPANQATLVEPLDLKKSINPAQEAADMELIKSVQHLAIQNVPSFRHIERRVSAVKIKDNLDKIQTLSDQLGLNKTLPEINPIIFAKQALKNKIMNNMDKISNFVKALTAGYGGGSMPTSLTGGGVLQEESQDKHAIQGEDAGHTGKKKKKKKLQKSQFDYITCDNCGKEQIHARHQVKCRECNKSFSLEKLHKLIKSRCS